MSQKMKKESGRRRRDLGAATKCLNCGHHNKTWRVECRKCGAPLRRSGQDYHKVMSKRSLRSG